MYLIPGDSAMGYRLPLDSLPWVSEADYPYLREHDPSEPRTPFPAYDALRAPRPARTQSPLEPPVAHGESARRVVRTTVCTETRNGVLYVFLPPVPDAAAYLELAAAVESTAARLTMPVVLEGYPPPDDPRLEQLPDHARSGRHRSQRAAGDIMGPSS